jgi:Flp pilus assembly protein TadG
MTKREILKMRSKLKQRRKTAHSIIELAMLSVLFAIVAVFTLDIGFVITASQINDEACRDAARAAAQANNYDSAIRLARAALASHKTDGYFVTQPVLDAPSFVYEDYAGDPPENTSPFVTATTSVTVRIPAPVLFIGATFGEGGTMNFQKTYTFPIVKTQLYLSP